MIISGVLMLIALGISFRPNTLFACTTPSNNMDNRLYYIESLKRFHFLIQYVLFTVHLYPIYALYHIWHPRKRIHNKIIYVATHQSLARKGYKQKQSANNLNFNSQNSTWTIGLQLYDESLVNYGTTHSLVCWSISSSFLILVFFKTNILWIALRVCFQGMYICFIAWKKINLFNDLIKIMKKFYRWNLNEIFFVVKCQTCRMGSNLFRL